MPLSPDPAVPSSLDSPVLLPRPRGKKPKPKRRYKPRFTDRENHFISLILQGIDRTTAAIQAGYAEKSAAVAAYRLVRKPKIVAVLSEHAQQAAQANAIDAPYVIETIKAEIEYLKSDPDRSAAASQAIFRGTELLGKTIALFRDRVEEDRQITVTIERIGG